MSENNNDITEVDISPEVSMYNLLESYPYDLGNALSEYVDNSVQAFLNNKEETGKDKIRVTITVDFSDKNNKKIIIEDDGVGITDENLQRAMKPAFKPDEQSLNEFGIGMKAASIWIGRKWTLLNSHIAKKVCQKIIFDLDKLIVENKGTIPVDKKTQDCNSHGVVIIIENLNHEFDEDQIQDAFLTLEENYQYFTDVDKVLDLHLTFTENNKLASLSKDEINIPKVLVSRKMIIKRSKPYWAGEEKTWKKNVEFEFNNKPVKGFVMCREISSHKNPGIKIFREKRLIEGTLRNPNRPIDLLDTANKHASLRFYAELHLDGQKISNNKAKLAINEKLFYKTLQEQDGVQEILDQAKNYKADAVKKGKVEEIQEDANTNSQPTSKEKQDPSQSNKPNNSPQNTAQTEYTDVLDLIIKNTKDMIVKNIAKEAKKLYGLSDWGFVLCYRVIAEKVIQEKIKSISLAKYNQDKIVEKGIINLITWLNNNKKILNLNDEWKTLDRNLNQISGSNKFDITNLVGHGHYYPTKQEIEILLANTQKLLEWAVSRE